MTKYLVTGGAGFIGSNIGAELLKRREQVRVLDNFATGKKENIAQFLDDIELVEGDLRDPRAVQQATQGIDYILHQGALPSVPRSIEDPLTTNAVNIVGTLNLLIAARDAGVKRLVYASSSSVYGDNPALPKVEQMNPAPKSPYAISKLAGEHYCQAFTRVFGLQTVCLRYFNVFGPNQDPTSPYAAVIPKFVTLMMRGERPPIYGDGLQSRDFTYVANVVQANLLAVEASEVAGEVINVACGKRYTLLELVDTINRILDTQIEPTFTTARPGDVKHSQADIGKAQKLLGFRVELDFEEGLEKTIGWYRNRLGYEQRI
ncbi:MAG: SDR family oxidoreductase [Anaerolineae bacterium]